MIISQFIINLVIENSEICDKGQKKNLFPPLSWNNLYIKFYLRCSIY